ncbi:DNA/RNA non-specific endonuclease [Enterococcus sp. BWB1-3]|uniref:DNA/RNA non-specific endonuclease n=1 Tax=unclassified Enterococcus TaxID=2608891 RepID=UPI0019249C6A|nr:MULTISPECIES: DNA/RNA non-specific endonuclease [unclassified Enterococcus]MBL1230338.1 DNA/RNA non-specific endonuclease [Enterococcus sp. BWB1-3]MCB5951044.1 DNA/RNA non-specific endonuclease [Enterococcus sp. BWT-B8]MCB5955126.1 DNA/RNA non-specific endonuclease [Enterococcus sp. CWB-B31]
MAKKNDSLKHHPMLLLAGVLIILVLSVLGIQVPDQIQELFGMEPAPVEQSIPSPPSNGESTNPGPEELGTATFTDSELKDSKKGWITYHELDSLGRATGAEALLKPEMVNTGTSAKQEIRPPGFISGKEPYNHSRGHLIGRQMGGTGDDARNLTTLYQTPVNTPYMTKYENQVRKAMDDGETIRYRVTPIYEGSDLLCKEIELEAKGLSRNTTVNFLVRIKNEK